MTPRNHDSFCLKASLSPPYNSLIRNFWEVARTSRRAEQACPLPMRSFKLGVPVQHSLPYWKAQVDTLVNATRSVFAPHPSTQTMIFGHTSVFKRLSPLNNTEQTVTTHRKKLWLKVKKKWDSLWPSAMNNQSYHFQKYCRTVNNPALPGSQHYASRDEDEELIQPQFLGKRFK